MTDIPINQQAEVSDGNSVFDDVWVLNKLHYDFTNSGTITISNLNVIGIFVSSFCLLSDFGTTHLDLFGFGKGFKTFVRCCF